MSTRYTERLGKGFKNGKKTLIIVDDSLKQESISREKECNLRENKKLRDHIIICPVITLMMPL